MQGLFEIGSAQAPFTHRAVVTLTGNNPDKKTPFSDGVGNKVLAVLAGGKLELHGQAKTSWSKLAKTAGVGATSLEVLDASGWQIGDTLAVAPSDLSPFEMEEVVITAITGNTVSFTPALNYQHWGELQTQDGHVLDMRAEVANLNRNILLTSDAKVYPDFAGHVIFREGSSVHLNSIEVTRMGQPGKLGRYSLHFHLARNMSGSYIKTPASTTFFSAA